MNDGQGIHVDSQSNADILMIGVINNDIDHNNNYEPSENTML